MVCDKMVSFGLVGTMVGLLSFNRICERARWLLVGKELMSQHEWNREPILGRYDPMRLDPPKVLEMTREANTAPYIYDWKRYSCLDLGLDEDGKGAK